MLVEGIERSVAVTDCVHTGIPDQQAIVVSTTGKIFPIGRPLQPTHFLFVSGKGSDMVIGHTDIMVMNCSAFATTKNKQIHNYYFKIFLYTVLLTVPLSQLSQFFFSIDNFVIASFSIGRVVTEF